MKANKFQLIRKSIAGTLATIAVAVLFVPVTFAAAKQKIAVAVRADSEAVGYEAWRAMDGDTKTMWHSDFDPKHPVKPLPHTLTVDLGAAYTIKGFTVTPRQDTCNNGKILRYEVYVANDPASAGDAILGEFPLRPSSVVPKSIVFDSPRKGRYFILKVLAAQTGDTTMSSVAELSLNCETAVFLAKNPSDIFGDYEGNTDSENIAEYNRLSRELRQKKRFAKIAPETFLRESLILESDRDPLDVLLRRTEAVYNDLKNEHPAPDFTLYGTRLASLKKEADATGVDDKKKRVDVFVKIRALRREIVFSNPLLNFDSLLFVKKHRSTYSHMCDQFYGATLPAGGGIFILKNPFAKNARDQQIIDVFKDSVVQSGRLAGTKLSTGSFLSPDISFDGKRLAFAYVECVGDKKHRFHTDPTRGHWHEGRSFHIFTSNIDGSDLRQITDGTWNDFDPCWLPNGRLAFITERRGGYLRCGRVCPTYTLFDMNPDGTKMRCLSYHETNEWQPSVTNDGRILYTRWDYPDRHGCTAHQPWITTLDGRGTRHVHGNFAPRNKRPDMELDCRSIPGSPKYIATAAPHHGQAFGSLVLVDPRVEDDNAMAPVKRITPDVDFPESQGGQQIYGTPWPLSEKYYLAVADFDMTGGTEGRPYKRGNYGIYLVDAFGNKELVYRDPEIGSLSPMPVRSRPRPPVQPEQISPNIEHQPYLLPERAKLDKLEKGRVLVTNTYQTIFPFPENVKIKALRVIQLLPMSVPSGNRPHEIGFREPSSSDSVVLARHVLGTVPVEEDGSAFFEVPPRREFLLQALDENGLAVQSMRSSIYLHDGETLSCTGCHEQTASAIRAPAHNAKAFQRKPSTIKPAHPDARPFSYPRLVQPILDKHCVKCHDDARAKGKTKAVNLGKHPLKSNWFASYNNLVPKFGFYSYGNPLRTYPGKFGARASKLYPMLKNGHGGVKLSKEEMERIALWLDCVSPFYGVYEREGGIAQLGGKIVWPTLE
ncbi:MAG: discoidin domain-containing protein [Puniceicoccales bacterium]|nr:discoidin domain-containing protein [Puniceicoccales bacterium]